MILSLILAKKKSDIKKEYNRNIERYENKKSDVEEVLNRINEYKKKSVSNMEKFSCIIKKIKNQPPEFRGKIPREMLEQNWKIGTVNMRNTHFFCTVAVASYGFEIMEAINLYKSKKEMEKIEREIDTICEFLEEVEKVSKKFITQYKKMDKLSSERLIQLDYIINVQRKYDWNAFSKEEQLFLENTIRVIGILFSMCKIQVVSQSNEVLDMSCINKKEINEMSKKVNAIVKEAII